MANENSEYSYCPGTCASYVSDPVSSSISTLRILLGSREDRQDNLNNTVMLINYVKVFQQSGSAPIRSQAMTNENQTGVGGAVAHLMPNEASRHVLEWAVWVTLGIGGLLVYFLL